MLLTLKMYAKNSKCSYVYSKANIIYVDCFDFHSLGEKTLYDVVVHWSVPATGLITICKMLFYNLHVYIFNL